MEKERIGPNLPAKVARVILKGIAFILLFILLLFVLLLTPPAQKFLTARVQHYLENKLHTKVRIERISFGLSGRVALHNLYIEDRSRDTLVSGGLLKARVNFLKLFSNEVRVKDLELDDLTAKIKRVLPDTVYNFQFIVDAFLTQNKNTTDTSTSTPMKLDIDQVSLKNIDVNYKDAIAGSDMFAHIGDFTARIDTLDPYTQHFVIPAMVLKNSTARMKQSKPLVEPKPVGEYIAAAAAPSNMNLQFGTLELDGIHLEYANEVSAVYTNDTIGKFLARSKSLDLIHNRIVLDEISLDNSSISARMGKTKPAKIIKQEAKKEVVAQAEAGWNVIVNKINLSQNAVKFDDDNQQALSSGIDFSHILANEVSLSVENLTMTPSSAVLTIRSGTMDEKSGLKIEQVQADIAYGDKQSSIRNLYLKTPGSEIRRSLILNYASLDDLVKHPEKTSAEIDLAQTRIQVKDILLFAPQLRSNPALKDPNGLLHVNIRGSGSMNQFNFEALQFAGLSNTQLDAHGTLTGLADPKKAGGNFTITRFHTNQNDIALFTGSKLSNAQMDLPSDFTMAGTIQGNSGILDTRLSLVSSDGVIAMNGRFGNLSAPATTSYHGMISVRQLKLGKILRQPSTIGLLTATASFNGKGITPASINTSFSANIASAGYNQYQYQNINLDGSLHKTDFKLNASIRDANADASLIVNGNFSDHPAFAIHGMIDSVKTMPLHFTSESIVFRSRIDGSASNISADNMTADFLFTQVLFVSNAARLALDTVQVSSGRNDTANYMRLNSSIANAEMTGQYKLAELGDVFLNSVQPYFSTSSGTQKPVAPYSISFSADAAYHPIFSALLPGLTSMKTAHAAGSLSSSNGMNAELEMPEIVYQGTAISDLKIKANTNANGLQVTGVIAHIKSGSSLDIYNARLNAVVLNNKIDFSLGIDDAKAKNKYFLAGIFSQPGTGVYAVQLKQEGLLLNYQAWTVSAGNMITISPDNITANNFVLQNGGQRLSINSPADRGQQLLAVEFANFRLSTITGFLNADSVLADGLINGNARISDFLKQPNLTSDLTINDLSLRNDTVGNLSLHASTSGLNRYNIDTKITGKGNDLSLAGWVATAGEDLDLNLDLNVKALQLHTMEGAMAGVIRNASGSINGAVSIRGTANQPLVNGDLNFAQTSFILSLLGSRFHLDDQKLSVTSDGLSFDNFTIKDSSGNALALNGKIATSDFINYQFDLKVVARNFMLLNSTKKDNPIYYGKMNISTDLSITGTELKPVVDGRITVNDGTALSFVVPQADQGIQSRDGIVEFVDMRNPASDTLFNKKYDSLNRTSVLGMDIALNIEVKKEAVFNIIVDAANGDFLNAQGEAQLTAGIDPSGKVTLTGNYTLESGAYQLSFNFLQRKFEITRGSTITWTGEPTTAKLQIGAVYIANTAPIDLVSDQVEASSAAIRNTYLQKLPFELHLNLTGELMKPVVAFDIILPEDKNYGVSNDVVTTVQYKLAQLRQDEGETNKQVFALLLLNRFVGENPFSSAGGSGFNAGTYARQSASKLLTEQLNSLAAGLINGVDVNFDVASSEDYTTGSMRNRTDLNLNVSKRLLSDRLKISVGSNFELEGPQNSNQQSNNIAGNLAVDYQLSRDGRYLLRFFRKNDYEGEIDGYVIENGLSFIISIDYNRFREILHHRKQRVVATGKQKGMVP